MAYIEMPKTGAGSIQCLCEQRDDLVMLGCLRKLESREAQPGVGKEVKNAQDKYSWSLGGNSSMPPLSPKENTVTPISHSTQLLSE